MLKRLPAFLLFVLVSGFIQAQQIKILHAGGNTSIRGLSVVSDRVIWVSGSTGSVGLSTDSGKNWKWMQVPRYEKSDFRDIEAFSDLEAVIMGITEPAVILRTSDAGKIWTTVFEDSSKTLFLDAIDFSGNQGAVIGDPDSGRIFFAESPDRGKSWQKKHPSGFDSTARGEAFFAASGSNIRRFPDGPWVIISGGKRSDIYFGNKSYTLQMNQGRETTGANSIAIHPSDPNQAFITGGDFAHDTLRFGNSVHIQFRPFIQTPPQTPPHGYRSCVEYLDASRLICCGTSGVDFSTDGGMNWKLISSKSFHICRKSKTGHFIYLAGAKGSIARLDF